MISRTLLAAILAVGTGTAALAQVQVETPSVQVNGNHLGEVAAIANGQLYVDIGGFLGIGETRVLLDDDQIDSVTDDRIVLKLTENEASALPAADQETATPK